RCCSRPSSTWSSISRPRRRLASISRRPYSPLPTRSSNDAAVCGVARVMRRCLRAGNKGDIDTAFGSLAEGGAQALLVAADPFFNSLRERIVALAMRYRLGARFESRGYAVAGGLMSYGPDLSDMYRQVGSYTGQILKGVKPADLPVIQPTALELVINLKTARALGLEIPPTLLARADE